MNPTYEQVWRAGANLPSEQTRAYTPTQVDIRDTGPFAADYWDESQGVGSIPRQQTTGIGRVIPNIVQQAPTQQVPTQQAPVQAPVQAAPQRQVVPAQVSAPTRAVSSTPVIPAQQPARRSAFIPSSIQRALLSGNVGSYGLGEDDGYGYNF